MLIREWIGNSQGHAWRLNHHVAAEIPFNLHFHPEFELTLTLGAQGLRQIGSDRAQFQQCDLALVAPNQPHSWQAGPRADARDIELQVVLFRLDWLVALAEHGLPEIRPLCQWLASIRQGVVFSHSCAQSLARQLAHLHELQGLQRLTTLLDILAALQHDSGARFIAGEATAAAPDRRLERAMAYMQAHFHTPLTLDELATAAACSVTTLKRLFSQQLQSSFSHELSRLRIAHACQLLVSSERGVAWVAAQSGYPCSSLFYRHFQAHTGQTPSDFRQHSRLGKPTRGIASQAN
ncbi:helix-turn-helix domain-containing protein [Chitinibacter tainanensis]|uniref:helix-turn-helix domain-containing protein n=1 Tax=Chitinibacter tainanensis TaxID=230667 RepID=UPI0004281043|nr:AraC family transcriptional regulator [Chitinibacter tainanensis]